MNSESVISINPFEVKFLIHRERAPEEFRLLKDSICELGVLQPLHVRDITGWPAKDRKRPQGGLDKWEAVFGEGRTTACRELYVETQDRRYLQLPAIVKNIPEGEIVGRFLAENILRRKHAWLDQARLIQADVENGANIPRIAAEYHITEAHAAKLLRVLGSISSKWKERLNGVALNTAEKLIALPRGSQDIVLEAMTEAGLDNSQTEAVVSKAREITDTGQELSKTALKQSLQRVQQDLDELRGLLKLKRLHWSLGVSNCEILLADNHFRKELDRAGINYSKLVDAIGNRA